MNEDFNTPVAIVEFNRLMKVIARDIGSGDGVLLAEMNTLVRDFGEQVLGLRFVAEEIANLRNMSVDEIIDITTRNAEEFFNI